LYSRPRERIRTALGFLLIGPGRDFPRAVQAYACMHVCMYALAAFVRIALIYTSERRTADTMR